MRDPHAAGHVTAWVYTPRILLRKRMRVGDNRRKDNATRVCRGGQRGGRNDSVAVWPGWYIRPRPTNATQDPLSIR